MAEYLSSPEENMPESLAAQFVDKLSSPAWDHFASVVHETERVISYYDPRDLSTHNIIDQLAVRLNKEFDYAYDDPRCQITMFARRGTEEDGVSTNRELFINTDQALFKSVDILALEGHWRVILAIDLIKEIDDAPSGLYYVQPDPRHLAELKFLVDADKEEVSTDAEIATDLRSRLVIYADESRDIIASPAFASRHPAGQRVILQAIAGQLAGEIMREYSGAIVDVNCADYYVAYDEEPTLNLLDTYTDVSLLPESEEESTLAGVIEGFGYPELDTLPLDQPITLEPLTINHGAPCMTVYNEKLGRRYYIPVQSVISII
jgi:hypothetical protein